MEHYLVTTIAEQTKSIATGFMGSTNYVPVTSGKLPSAGKTLQTVKGKNVKAYSLTVDKRNP